MRRASDKTKQVPWSKVLLERFIADMDGVMTDLEEMVLRRHVARVPHLAIATELHVSLSTMERCVALLKKMYDRAQASDPMLPPRKRDGGLKV